MFYELREQLIVANISRKACTRYCVLRFDEVTGVTGQMESIADVPLLGVL